MTDEWITERELADALGVVRDTVRRARRYAPMGAIKVDGSTVLWQKKAAASFAQSLNLALPECLLAPQGAPGAVVASPEKTPGSDAVEPVACIEVLTVDSTPGPGGWHFANHHLIRARKKTGESVVVRVVDSRKYLPRCSGGVPMELRARKAADGNWWLLVGREPRWPGRW